MDAKHTPGPWYVTQPNGPSMGWRIGPAWLGEKVGTPEGEANARLIAAAPDMYEARAERDRLAWLIIHGERVFGSLWREATQADIRAAQEKRRVWEVEGEGEASKPSGKQVGGDHYKKYKIQPDYFVFSNKIPYHEGSAIKYIVRHRDKGGADDIRKAIHFLELILEYEYTDEKDNP